MIDFWITFEILSRGICCWRRISEQVSRHCSANSRNLWKICWGEFSKHVLYLFLVGTSKKRHQGRLETIWILLNGKSNKNVFDVWTCNVCKNIINVQDVRINIQTSGSETFRAHGGPGRMLGAVVETLAGVSIFKLET